MMRVTESIYKKFIKANPTYVGEKMWELGAGDPILIIKIYDPADPAKPMLCKVSLLKDGAQLEYYLQNPKVIN